MSLCKAVYSCSLALSLFKSSSLFTEPDAPQAAWPHLKEWPSVVPQSVMDATKRFGLVTLQTCAACCLSDRRRRLPRRRRRLHGTGAPSLGPRPRHLNVEHGLLLGERRTLHCHGLAFQGIPRVQHCLTLIIHSGHRISSLLSLSNIAAAWVWGVCAGVGAACAELLMCLCSLLLDWPLSAKFCGIHLAAAGPPSPCSSPREAWMHKQYGSNAWRLRPCPGSKSQGGDRA